MAARAPIVTIEEIEDLKAKGWNQSQIAEHYGVTRQYISYIKKRYGGSRTVREIALDEYPWKVPVEMTSSGLYRLTRDHMAEMAGAEITPSAMTRLERFRQRLRDENLVVEFAPDIPPNRDCSAGGFMYRVRQPSDGDLIIRVNEYTKLSERGRELLRLPDQA